MNSSKVLRLASVLIASTISLVFSGPLFGAPKDVYVTTTGAGDMDGRDWDNAMFNITAAYALCAANADGGTVHLAGGIYRSTGWDATLGNFTQNAAIVPASNVTLRGSDDKDDPTILTGDCTLDNEWYTGNVKKQWQDGKLVEPEEDAHTYSIPKGAQRHAFLHLERCNRKLPVRTPNLPRLYWNGLGSLGFQYRQCRPAAVQCREYGL